MPLIRTVTTTLASHSPTPIATISYPNPNPDFDNHVRGYPKLVAEMAKTPEHAIFRRFGALNAHNLLYM